MNLMNGIYMLSSRYSIQAHCTILTDFYEKTADDKSTIGLSGSLDCSVKIWNLDTGRFVISVACVIVK